MDLIVTVPDDRVSFVKKLLRELNLRVKPAAREGVSLATPLTVPQQQLAEGLKQSLRQVDLHQQGKVKLPSAYDLLDEV